MKKVRSFLCLAMALILFTASFNVNDYVITTKAATFSDINQAGVFVKQQAGDTCTLAAAVMMIRRTVLASGNTNWSSITEASMKSTAWAPGLYYNFTYAGVSVGHATINSDVRLAYIDLLNKYPQGVVAYNPGWNYQSHAILLTDYDATTDTFYCSDPANNTASGRIPLNSSSIKGQGVNGQNDKLSVLTEYWYVKAPNVTITEVTQSATMTKASYPSHCTIKVTENDKSIMSLPCSNKTNSKSDKVESAPKGTTYEAIGLILNTEGNLWYKVKAKNGKEGYIFAGNVSFVSAITSDITGPGISVPSNHTHGKTYVLTGSVNSSYNELTNVSAYVYSGSNKTTGGTASVNGKSYSLGRSAIDNQTEFNKLAVGQYTYKVTASYKSYYAKNDKTYGTKTGSVTVFSKTFNVVSGSVTPPSSDTVTPPVSGSNEEIIFNFLKTEVGLNTAAACGVLANIEKESGFRNDVLEYGYTWETGGGYGICQWTNSPRTSSSGRRTNLVNWCTQNGYDYKSLIGQLNYLKHELSSDYYYKHVTSKLLAVSNTAEGAYDAGYIWCYYFEVPAGYNTGVSVDRGNSAKTNYWPKYCDYTQPTTIIYPNNGGIYKIAYGGGNNMYLDFSCSSNNVQIYENCDGHSDPAFVKSQYFRLTHIGDGWYSITNIGNGKAIDIAGVNPTSGTNIQQWEYLGNDGQLFRFYDAGNGYCYIKSKLGTYIDKKDGDTSSDTNVWSYAFNGTVAQKWKLLLIEDIISTDESRAVNDKHYTNVDKLRLQGWAFSNRGRAVTFSYILDSNSAVSVNNVYRPDVKQAYPDICAFDNVGYDFSIDLSKLSVGEHAIKVVANSFFGTSLTVSNLRFYVDSHTHSYSSAVTTEATCAKEGVRTYTCNGCSDSYTEPISKVNHNYENWSVTKTATCTTMGTQQRKCSKCNAVQTQEIAINTSAHKWDNGTITTAATCKAKGVKTYTCQYNSAHTKTENLGLNTSNHVNTKNVSEVKATCTITGYTTGIYCNDCQKYISGHSEIAKNPSNHVNTKNVSATPATTDKVGYTEGVYCNDCQKYVSGHVEIPKLENIGDVDGDGQITASDARLALRASVGLDKISDAQKKSSDVDKDGQITSSDARLILRAAVGLEDPKAWMK